jgi:hypothetical protein
VRSVRGRRGGVAVAAAGVLLATAGCGFLSDLADPDEAPPTSSGTAPDPGPVAEPPAGPVVVVEGLLVGVDGGHGGPLTVTVGEPATGLVPPVPNFSDSCPVEPAALQYVPVQFAGVPGLAARVDVARGPATPADVGDVGVVVESGNGDERYCFDYPPLPTADRFWNQMGAASVTGYVVLDAAVTPATPQGRPEVFPTLELRISDLRSFPDASRITTLAPGELSVGRVCVDDPGAICVPLG